MNQEKTKNGVTVIRVIFYATMFLIVCSAIIFSIYVSKKFDATSDSAMDDIIDELSRARFFILDWYAEISEAESGYYIYLNELRFAKSGYTMTYAGGRLRAVYQRGDRFFKLYHIDKIEFFELNEKIRCRFYYGSGEEFTFTVEKNKYTN